MSESVTVDKYPMCDFCRDWMGRATEARYDAKTMGGPWANMCERHFEAHGIGLGVGRGQRYLLRSSMDLHTIDLDHDLGIRDLTDPFTGEMV